MISLIISITTIYLILMLSFSYGIKKNKEFYKKVNTFRKILNEILNITQNNIELIDEEIKRLT